MKMGKLQCFIDGTCTLSDLILYVNDQPSEHGDDSNMDLCTAVYKLCPNCDFHINSSSVPLTK